MEAGQANQEKGNPDDSEKEPNSPPEREGLGLKALRVEGEDVGRNNRPTSSANPANGSRARNTEMFEQARVPLFANEVAHSVVVGLTAGNSRHRSWLLQARGEAS